MWRESSASVGFLHSLEDNSDAAKRVSQYKSPENGKGIGIAKRFVSGKIEGQNRNLRKYGFRQHDFMRIKETVVSLESDELKTLRNRLLTIEGHATERYFSQVFQLLPTAIGVEKRRTFKAFDGINNTLNMAYAVLKWKVHRAIIKAKMEPFLGFLHSEQFGKPSLVCDLMELYRYLIDDFVIQYCQHLRKKDFQLKQENYSSTRKGERQYLSKPLADDMMKKLNLFFETVVEIQRIRHGKRQTLVTLINEEALLLAAYLRNEKKSWIPRVANLVLQRASENTYES